MLELSQYGQGGYTEIGILATFFLNKRDHCCKRLLLFGVILTCDWYQIDYAPSTVSCMESSSTVDECWLSVTRGSLALSPSSLAAFDSAAWKSAYNATSNYTAYGLEVLYLDHTWTHLTGTQTCFLKKYILSIYIYIYIYISGLRRCTDTLDNTIKQKLTRRKSPAGFILTIIFG